MADDQEYLLELLKKLINHKVQFVVCGGVAAVLHGVQRLTVDLDLALMMNPENLNRFLAVMTLEGMVPRAPIPAESILDPQVLESIVRDKGALVFTFVDPQNACKQVDFFLTADKSYEALINETLSIDLDQDQSLKVLTIDKLIAMKRTIEPLRTKDQQDITELMRLKGQRS